MTLKDTIVNTTSETVDIINKVDSFYNSAWEKLLIFGGVIGFVIGILVPIIIQYYQKALLKQSEKLLEEKIENETAKINEELKLEIEKQLQNHLKEYNNKLNKIQSHYMAMILHKQAGEILKRGDYKSAVMDYIKACANYITSEKYDSVNILLDKIKECIQRLTIEDIDDFKIYKADIDAFYSIIEKSPVGAAYIRDIITIKDIISKLPNRPSR